MDALYCVRCVLTVSSGVRHYKITSKRYLHGRLATHNSFSISRYTMKNMISVYFASNDIYNLKFNE